MARSNDYDELLYYWTNWHEAIGPQLKNKYLRYVQLANQAAKSNGISTNLNNFIKCSRISLKYKCLLFGGKVLPMLAIR